MSDDASWRDRVKEELEQLNFRIEKLSSLVFGPTFEKLPRQHQWLLTTQCHHMVSYAAILTARLEL